MLLAMTRANETVLVLGLDDGAYWELGVYRRGDMVPSTLLGGLRVDAAALFDAPKPQSQAKQTPSKSQTAVQVKERRFGQQWKTTSAGG